MLIDSIRKDLTLRNYFENTCSENGVSVNIDSTILIDDILIIKVDKYYNSEIRNHAKCPDCLVIQRCSENNYILYIIELKNIDSPSGFKVTEIVEKFTTCLDDFMSQRFGSYFHATINNYINIRLLFVSDPYHFKRNPERQQYIRGHKFEALLGIQFPKYFGKNLFIASKIPDPIIRNCSGLT